MGILWRKQIENGYLTAKKEGYRKVIINLETLWTHDF